MEIKINRRNFLKFFGLNLVGLFFSNNLLANIKYKKLRLAGAYNYLKKNYYGVFNLNGDFINNVELPVRAHDSVLIPFLNQIVIISRRPKNKLYILDLNNNEIVKEITSPCNRHFYGHAVYSNKTNLLYVSENLFAYDDERSGSLALYDPIKNYKRVGEYRTQGIGPHEIKLDSKDNIVIANGGVLTNPDFPRVKLNINNIVSNITKVNIYSGKKIKTFNLKKEFKDYSIRHLDIDNNNEIHAGCQVYNKRKIIHGPLVFYSKKDTLYSYKIPKSLLINLKQYTGSIKLNLHTREIYSSFPKDDMLLAWSMYDKKIKRNYIINDVCGLAYDNNNKRILISDGEGNINSSKPDNNLKINFNKEINFDNHFITFNT